MSVWWSQLHTHTHSQRFSYLLCVCTYVHCGGSHLFLVMLSVHPHRVQDSQCLAAPLMAPRCSTVLSADLKHRTHQCPQLSNTKSTLQRFPHTDCCKYKAIYLGPWQFWQKGQGQFVGRLSVNWSSGLGLGSTDYKFIFNVNKQPFSIFKSTFDIK